MSVAELTIRPVAEGDRAEWGRLWQGYLTFYRTELSTEVYDTLFGRLLEPGPDGPFGLLAVAGGQPVGLVHYLHHLHCWRPEGVIYLQDLFVAPEARGTGAGRALIEAVYAAADAAGRPYVYWTTEHHNTAARLLYDRIGLQTNFIKYVRG